MLLNKQYAYIILFVLAKNPSYNNATQYTHRYEVFEPFVILFCIHFLISFLLIYPSPIFINQEIEDGVLFKRTYVKPYFFYP